MSDECWSYSDDEQFYQGTFATWQEAAREYFHDREDEVVHVGRIVPATPPEHYISAGLILEHVWEQYDYGSDIGDAWPAASKAQCKELTMAMQQTFAEWLDQHNLRPTFQLVEDVRKVTREELNL